MGNAKSEKVALGPRTGDGHERLPNFDEVMNSNSNITYSYQRKFQNKPVALGALKLHPDDDYDREAYIRCVCVSDTHVCPLQHLFHILMKSSPDGARPVTSP